MPKTPAQEWIRFAARVVAEPGRAVSLWKAISGWRAACCPPGFPFPEILHSVELLPVFAGGDGSVRCQGIPFDAWVPAVEPHPVDAESALDRVEALAEWAESVTGRRCTEGALERSVRAYADREGAVQALAARCEAEPAFLSPDARRNLVDAGDFVPVDSHSRLLRSVLGGDAPTSAALSPRGDPFLRLALRIC